MTIWSVDSTDDESSYVTFDPAFHAACVRYRHGRREHRVCAVWRDGSYMRVVVRIRRTTRCFSPRSCEHGTQGSGPEAPTWRALLQAPAEDYEGGWCARGGRAVDGFLAEAVDDHGEALVVACEFAVLDFAEVALTGDVFWVRVVVEGGFGEHHAEVDVGGKVVEVGWG
jgi:hypothetical protein